MPPVLKDPTPAFTKKCHLYLKTSGLSSIASSVMKKQKVMSAVVILDMRDIIVKMTSMNVSLSPAILDEAIVGKKCL